MKKRRLYRISLTDEARLIRLGSLRLTPGRIALALACLLTLATGLGLAVVWLTPLKTFLPGYMRESQRAAMDNTMLRLDSLQAAYRLNEAFLNNIAAVLDTERIPVDSLRTSSHTNQLTPDSLLTASPEETRFVKMMQEREKYNLSVIAPLAAEGLMFYPLSDEAIISPSEKESLRPGVIMARRTMISAIADGTVLAVYSPDLSGRYSIIIQHPRSFVSRISGTGMPLVGDGDEVAGGQAIAIVPPSMPDGGGRITVELWHNGTPLPPYPYMNPDSHPAHAASE